MEWTNDLIFDFLNLYQNEPSLWNITLPEHKNTADAYEAWYRIKVELKDGNIPIKELKKKRDNLMSTYRRQRTKVIDSLASGDADDVFKPEWPFYNLMASFLDDIYNPRKTKNYEEPHYTEDNEEDTSVDEEIEIKPIVEIIETFPKKTPRKRKLLDNEDIKKPDDEESETNPTDPDESHLYCNLLCKKLRGLKERTRDIAMMEIDRFMYHLKQQDKQTSRTQNQNATPSVVQPYNQYTKMISGLQPPLHAFFLPNSQ